MCFDITDCYPAHPILLKVEQHSCYGLTPFLTHSPSPSQGKDWSNFATVIEGISLLKKCEKLNILKSTKTMNQVNAREQAVNKGSACSF